MDLELFSEMFRRVRASKLLLAGCLGGVACVFLGLLFLPFSSTLGGGMVWLGLVAMLCVPGLLKSVSDQIKKERPTRKQIIGLWEPVNGKGVTLQFTDGALMRGDGLIAKYRWLLSDKIELVHQDARSKTIIHVYSLSPTDLVVRIDGSSCHYRRHAPTPQAGDPVQSPSDESAIQTQGVSPVVQNELAAEAVAESSSQHQRSSGKGFWASLFGWLSNYKCPRCGAYSGKETSKEYLGMQQRVAGRYVNGRLEQVWVNIHGYDVHIQCQDCGFPWVEQQSKQEIA
jgi:hypothetical protein